MRVAKGLPDKTKSAESTVENARENGTSYHFCAQNPQTPKSPAERVDLS